MYLVFRFIGTNKYMDAIMLKAGLRLASAILRVTHHVYNYVLNINTMYYIIIIIITIYI